MSIKKDDKDNDNNSQREAPEDAPSENKEGKPTQPPSEGEPIKTAAPKLGTKPTALRALLRRLWERHPESSTLSLGGGIVAFKLGRPWRIRFPVHT